MVIKGNARGGPADLAGHLQRTDTNERMEVKELRGIVAQDLDGALREMDALGAALRTKRTLYHASINTRADEPLTDEQRLHAVDRLEEALGLAGQPRVIVVHEKEGREHCHVVWARTDLEHMRAIRCDHNYRTHEEVARALEREFGHEKVQGVHAERDGKERPDRTPSHAEMQQAERSGLSPKEAKAWITTLWRATDSGKAFAAALESHGWVLARGDKRDFVVIDRAGEAHSLARRIEGAKAKDVRARMADIDPTSLPSVEQAKELQRERAAAMSQEKPTPEQTPQQTPAPQQQPTPEATAMAWEDKLAAAAIEKARQEEQAQRAEDAKAVLHISTSFVMRDNAMKDQQAAREVAAAERAERQAEAAARQETREMIREADKIERAVTGGVEKVADVADNALRVGAGIAGKVGDKLVDFADKALDLLVGTPASQQYTAADYLRPEVRRAAFEQQQARQARDTALDRLAEDIAAGRNLDAQSVQKLHRDDLENIKAKGEDHLRALIRQREEERSRYSRDNQGRIRERER